MSEEVDIAGLGPVDSDNESVDEDICDMDVLQAISLPWSAFSLSS